MKTQRALIASLGTVVLLGVLATPAQAVDTRTEAASWDQAAAQLGIAGSLWSPSRTYALKLDPPLVVVSDNLAFSNGAPTAGDTAANAAYGTRKRGFTMLEKWANTGWAAEPPTSTERAPIGRVRLTLGPAGSQVTVTATVSSDCYPQPKDGDPTPVPKSFRCTKADVLRHGGVLTMTARPASTMTAPGTTSIVIESTGLTYAQLIGVAKSLQQVGPVGGNDGAGSAQMRAMCEQMVDGRMSLAQAQAFSTANGYGTVRPGSIDGEGQALTMDYRWDRFTVDLVKGAVTNCTYG